MCLLYNAFVRLFSETAYKTKENRSRKKNSPREERTERRRGRRKYEMSDEQNEQRDSCENTDSSDSRQDCGRQGREFLLAGWRFAGKQKDHRGDL